jgi:hypothetical protein
MEGNTLIDCWKEPRRGSRCSRCNGSGRHEWEVSAFTDELDIKVYRRKKSGNPVKTFKELMQIARIMKADGQECANCEGTGEAYND